MVVVPRGTPISARLNYPIAGALLFFTLSLGAALLGLSGYPAPPVDPGWEAQPVDEEPHGALTVRFTGTTTLVFSDGETTWMTDGWFSRPGLLSLLMGEIEPDMDAIDRGLANNEITELAAVFPLHSHFDHAMDAPEVARRTGARLIGSEATANIGRGWGLPEEQIQIVADGDQLRLGDFTLTVIESRHFPYPDEDMVRQLIDDWEISSPLVPPVAAFDYKLGKAYVLHVEHSRGSFLVIGSAGFIPGQLAGMDVDVMFLGVGGLGSQSAAYRQAFWRETVEQVFPERIVPIHWDSLFGPIDGPFTGEVRIASLLSPGASELLAFLKEKENGNPAVQWMTLPRYRPVVLFP